MLLSIPASPSFGREHPVSLTVHLSETISRFRGKLDMRLVFNTTLTVDVSANDDELRAAFIELVTMKAREVYGPAAMLAKSRPALTISLTDRSGMNMIDVFEPTVEDRMSRD
jgi:hypothetical protein